MLNQQTGMSSNPMIRPILLTCTILGLVSFHTKWNCLIVDVTHIAEEDSELSVSELLERANSNLSECELLLSPCSSWPLLMFHLIFFYWWQFSRFLSCYMVCLSPFQRWSNPDWWRHLHWQRGREKRRPLHQSWLQVGKVYWREGLHSLLHRQSLL